jgi:hypothetical protein
VADGEGPSVERDAWMSEQVAGEIEELRRRFGFERKEAVAYWHLRHAHQLMSEMGQTDHFKELDREGRSELETDFREFAGLIHDISVLGESRVFQLFAAPYRELGTRVLRRNYPDGWARLTAARMKTAKEATARRSWWRKLRRR